MGQQLTNMAITRVSLVDKGANLRRFAVLKRDEEGPMVQPTAAIELPQVEGGPTGLAAFLRKIADAVTGKPAPVSKALTFAEIVRGQELNDALYDSWSTLQDSLWQAIYAYDEDGNPLSIEAKTELVGKNLDEYKAYLLDAMTSGIEKSAGSPAEAPSRHIAAIVAKVGRKISGSRLERLQAAAEALTGVLAEVVEETKDTDSAEAQEATVEKTELVAAVTEAITKAQEPLVARITALEEAKPAAAAAAPEAEGEDAPATLDTVVEVVGKLADRIEDIEKRISTGGRTSVVGQDGGTEVKKRSVFAGMF